MKQKILLCISGAIVIYLLFLGSYGEVQQRNSKVVDPQCLSKAKVDNINYDTKTMNVSVDKECKKAVLPKIRY